MIDNELAESLNKLFHVKENIQEINKVDAIKIKVEIEEKVVNMELNTGTSISIISECGHRRIFSHIKLETKGGGLKLSTIQMKRQIYSYIFKEILNIGIKNPMGNGIFTRDKDLYCWVENG